MADKATLLGRREAILEAMADPTKTTSFEDYVVSNRSIAELEAMLRSNTAQLKACDNAGRPSTVSSYTASFYDDC